MKEGDLIRDEREEKIYHYELNASDLEEIILWISELKGEDMIRQHKKNDFVTSIITIIPILSACYCGKHIGE